MSKITKFFDIYGMKCHSCELSVEHEINKLKGISNVSADHENSMVIVTYDDDFCDDNKIKNAIKNSGFSSLFSPVFSQSDIHSPFLSSAHNRFLNKLYIFYSYL